ncbi:MAG: GH116 family glycosyl hydrolase [Verrucomicrobiota bacterium]
MEYKFTNTSGKTLESVFSYNSINHLAFNAGALDAAVKMGKALGEDVSEYEALLGKSIAYLEEKLYNGEYFFQKVQTEGLDHEFAPLNPGFNGKGYKGIAETINEQGPKYQYGTGCLSDGVLGFWIARACGLDEIMDAGKIASHLRAVHKYNFRQDLSDHANTQRPSYAVGNEAGLLICSWPHGGKPILPFVYSDEVWTGIEYQVASHLMMHGEVEKTLEIVCACRDRYDGYVRNPFNEYECGHWYARAMASYGLIQGLTGLRYDAVDKTLHIDSRIGNDFRAFLSTASGFGIAGLKNGKPFVDVRSGSIDVDKVVVSGGEMKLIQP